MLRLLADEDLNGAIVRGLLRRRPDLELVRVEDVGLSGTDDPDLLEYAAGQGRMILTHDARTMTAHAYERVRAGKPMAGLCVADQSLAVGVVMDDVLLLVDASLEGEWDGQVIYLPL